MPFSSSHTPTLWPPLHRALLLLIALVVLAACGPRRKSASPTTPVLHILTSPLAQMFEAGREYQANKEYDKAIDSYRHCLMSALPSTDTVQAAGQQTMVVESMLQMLNIYQAKGEPEACAAVFDSLLADPTPYIKEWCLRDLRSIGAYALSRTERMPEAEALMDLALQTPMRNPSAARQFRDYAYAAAVYFSLPDRQDDVIHYCHAALHTADSADLKSGRLYVEQMLALLYKRTGRIQEANLLIKKGIDEAMIKGDTVAVATGYNTLTEMLLYWDLYREANDCASRGVEWMLRGAHFPNVHHPTIAVQLLVNKGAALEGLGQNDSAIWCWQQAAAMAQSLPYNSGMGDVDLHLGALTCKLNNHPLHAGSRACLQRAALQGTPGIRSKAYKCLAEDALRNHDKATAEACLDSMYALLHATDQPTFVKGASAMALQHYLSTGNVEKIKRYAQDLLDEEGGTASESNARLLTQVVVRHYVGEKQMQLAMERSRLQQKRTLIVSVVCLLLLTVIGLAIFMITRRKMYRIRVRLAEERLENVLAKHEQLRKEWQAVQPTPQAQTAPSTLPVPPPAELKEPTTPEQMATMQHAALGDIAIHRNTTDFYYRFNLLFPYFINNLHASGLAITNREELFCMLIVLKQDTQHVCEIMKLAPRSVNMLRYRLRRKFGLSSGHSLEEAILLFQQPDFKLPPEGMGAAMAERKKSQGRVTDSE